MDEAKKGCEHGVLEKGQTGCQTSGRRTKELVRPRRKKKTKAAARMWKKEGEPTPEARRSFLSPVPGGRGKKGVNK